MARIRIEIQGETGFVKIVGQDFTGPVCHSKLAELLQASGTNPDDASRVHTEQHAEYYQATQELTT